MGNRHGFNCLAVVPPVNERNLRTSVEAFLRRVIFSSACADGVHFVESYHHFGGYFDDFFGPDTFCSSRVLFGGTRPMSNRDC